MGGTTHDPYPLGIDRELLNGLAHNRVRSVNLTCAEPPLGDNSITVLAYAVMKSTSVVTLNIGVRERWNRVRRREGWGGEGGAEGVKEKEPPAGQPVLPFSCASLFSCHLFRFSLFNYSARVLVPATATLRACL